MIKQLKISKKLFILVISLLLCLIIIGSSSIVLMKRVNDASTTINKEWLPSIVIAEEVSTMISDHRIYELNHIISQDSATMEKYENNIDEKRKDIEKMFIAYEPLVKNETDRELTNDTKKIWKNYLAISDEIRGLSRKNQTEAAMGLLRGESRTLYDNLATTCLDIVNFNKEGAQKASDEGDTLFTYSIIVILCVMAIAIIGSTLLAIYIIRMIVKPMNEINIAANEITKGNLDIHIDYDSQDEVGEIAKAFLAMSSDLKNMIQDIKYLLGEMAEGNFIITTRCKERYIGEYEEILGAVHRINRTLSSTLSSIGMASDQVSSGSDQVASGAQALSQGATEQASSIEELSASIAEITSQVKQNAENCRLANDSAELAGKEIYSSNEQMKNMVDAMDEITAKSSEISKIIKVIEDIAFQTNILALNAAVEAARAGAAGKGFAVVADEVRNLASKSAEAAKGTTDLIGETLIAVQNGSKIANNTAESLDASAKITKEAVTLIDKIAKASDQQAQSIAQVDIGVEQISAVVQTNSATAEESAAASEELSGQAQMLKELIDKFKLREEKEFYEDISKGHIAIERSSVSADKY